MKKLFCLHNLSFVLIVLILFLSGCGQATVAVQRAQTAGDAEGNIVIGVAWPFETDNDLFEQGIDLAREEINEAGGVDGRKIQFVKKDDRAEVTHGFQVAQSFAKNEDMVAVIGHRNSYVSIPVSSVYEKAGMLMMSPASTAPDFSKDDHHLDFRDVSSDTAIADQLAQYAAQHDLRRTVIFYDDDDYGRGLANAFEKSADDYGSVVVDRVTFYGGQSHLQKLYDKWRAFGFDSIFVASGMPRGAEFVKAVREAGIDVPILGGNAMDNRDLIRIAGSGAEGVVVGSFFNPDSDRKVVKQFVQQFKAQYDKSPTQYSALGYDAVKLLAKAISTADSSVPEDIAAALRKMEHVEGIAGFHTYDENGNDVGDLIQIKKVSNGSFHAASTY